MSLIRWNSLVWPWHFVSDAPSLADPAFGSNRPLPHNDTPEPPQAFGVDAIWLAVRSTCAQAVAQALQLGHASPANWAEGLQAVHQPLPCAPGLVFVTPPIQGWVLVTGALPYPGGTADSDVATSLLQALSTQFSRVQYFGAHCSIAWHGYAKYEAGELVRAFACVDSVDHSIWDIGIPHDEPMPADHALSDQVAWHQARVFQMAERWSINPQWLPHMQLPPSLGQVGFLDPHQLGADALQRGGWPRAFPCQRRDTGAAIQKINA